jgi:hypothetical protein
MLNQMSLPNTLKATLEAYYQAVESQKTDQPLDLTASMNQLEDFSQNPPAQLHPQLRHYLESRSYRKAWMWLQGEAPEKGSCGR